MTAAPLRATRRGSLLGGLAVLATTGCDAVAPLPERTVPRTTPSTTGTPSDPDQALVAEVRGDLTQVSVLVTAALGALPGLRGELSPFATLHSQHLRALDGARPPGRSPMVGDAAELRATVRASEARLEASLASAALAAESGPLAVLLASMSAAVAQQLTVTA